MSRTRPRRCLARRKYKARILKRLRQRIKAAGWTDIQHVWVPRDLMESMGARAKALDMPRCIVLLAALTIGSRQMTTSEIIAAERRYRSVVYKRGTGFMKYIASLRASALRRKAERDARRGKAA